jgi:hypothetical protein
MRVLPTVGVRALFQEMERDYRAGMPRDKACLVCSWFSSLDYNYWSRDGEGLSRWDAPCQVH